MTQHLSSDHVALRNDTVPSVIDAATAVLGSVFDNLRVGAPCDRIRIVCPTAWGQREREAFGTAAAGFARELEFVEIALRGAELDPATQRSRRTVVIEFGLLDTAVSTVIYDHQGPRIENSESEPNLNSEEVGGDSGAEFLADLLRRVTPNGQADVVQIFGASDPALLSRIAGVAGSVFGGDVQLSPFSERDLFRSVSAAPDRPVVPSAPEWMEPLRARAAAIEPSSRVPKYIAAAVAAVIFVAGAAVAATVALTGTSEPTDVAAGSFSTTSITASAPTSRSTTSARQSAATLGKLESIVPAGWSRTNDPKRLVLIPEVGSGGRIIVETKPIVAGSGLAEIAADLDAQAEKRPAGTVTRVQRDAVLGTRTGLSYEERPVDGSTVEWLVLVEAGTQVSVGCQYLPDVRQRVMSACEAVVDSVRVAP
ncbi:type VII secretion-associated protein [Nocardia thailandica]